MDILVYYNNVEDKKPLTREVFWYDPFWKEMNVYECSKLDYKWTEEEYIKTTEGDFITVEAGIKKFVEYMGDHPERFEQKLMPEIYAEEYLRQNGYVKKKSRWKATPVTFHSKTTVKESKSIYEAYEKYANYNETSLQPVEETDEGIKFTLSEDSLDEVIYFLDNSGFRYEIES